MLNLYFNLNIMAKLRLNIERIEIIMSKFIFVIIDGVEYKKTDYIESRSLQNIYMFIKKNKDKITLMCYKVHNSDDHVNYIHLKNGKLHNLDGKAYYTYFYNKDSNLGSYYIDGIKYEYDNWIKKSRQIKLSRLINFT